MNENKLPKREIITLAIGEVIIGILISAVYLLIQKFDYKVPLGSLLGGAVTVFNFIFLSVSVNRAIDEAMANYNARQIKKPDVVIEETGSVSDTSEDADPYDDETAKFAQENAAKITNAVKVSYIVRTASVVIVLAVAFITKQFNVLATVIPILAFRPILTLSELLKKKGGES
ncbi:MAG: hypothetical protein E7673_04260 [Ruminococcaceae bacterium]|nr:hypothetical protein [Oscillospiraceae bacterium]